ncbi:hypothetical protein SASPL_131930 [Salvia splendens]|uniref:Alpha/beta hydrolase fold-3 domain-containing protein n=1 Tax=Salvia splendens TaxID=180675 RepID=A0A8X8X9Y8_SALSN|nr:hypothetical protein SASPL_131930 [Salvia splendens]
MTLSPSLNPKSKVLSKDIIIEPSLNISARLYASISPALPPPTAGGDGSEAWLRNNVDFDPVYVSGDSVGGNIAHNMVVPAGLEETGRVKFRGLFLNCPHFWGNEQIGNESSDPEMVAREESIWIHAYPNSTGFDDPLLNPDYNPNLSKLGRKKVVVYVAEYDILRERAIGKER